MATKPKLTETKIRELLEGAVPGAQELDKKLKRIWGLGNERFRLDQSSGSPDVRGRTQYAVILDDAAAFWLDPGEKDLRLD